MDTLWNVGQYCLLFGDQNKLLWCLYLTSQQMNLEQCCGWNNLAHWWIGWPLIAPLGWRKASSADDKLVLWEVQGKSFLLGSSKTGRNVLVPIITNELKSLISSICPWITNAQNVFTQTIMPNCQSIMNSSWMDSHTYGWKSFYVL